jgi:hypothetical protein
MSNSQRFTSAQFTATRFSSAKDKARFANHFVRFVQNDFPCRQFSQPFYQRLSNTFGHIAHFNLQGFYETFFLSPATKVDFLEQTLRSIPLGSPEHTYSDVERAIQEWLQQQQILKAYKERLASAVETDERALLATLQAKYPMPASVS